MSERTPFIGFSNETLAQCKSVSPGKLIDCPRCNGQHALETSRDGRTTVLFFKCGKDFYIGALNGRLIVGQPADVKGHV